jgi:hypothetical protein
VRFPHGFPHAFAGAKYIRACDKQGCAGKKKRESGKFNAGVPRFVPHICPVFAIIRWNILFFVPQKGDKSGIMRRAKPCIFE